MSFWTELDVQKPNNTNMFKETREPTHAENNERNKETREHGSKQQNEETQTHKEKEAPEQRATMKQRSNDKSKQLNNIAKEHCNTEQITNEANQYKYKTNTKGHVNRINTTSKGDSNMNKRTKAGTNERRSEQAARKRTMKRPNKRTNNQSRKQLAKQPSNWPTSNETYKRTRIQASKAKQSKARQGKARQSQANPSQAKPSQAKPGQARPGQARPASKQAGRQAGRQASKQASAQANTQTARSPYRHTRLFAVVFQDELLLRVLQSMRDGMLRRGRQAREARATLSRQLALAGCSFYLRKQANGLNSHVLILSRIHPPGERKAQ